MHKPTGFPENIPCEAIMDSVADGVFTVDKSFTVTSYNRAAARITGVPREEALGRKCWEVFHSSICDTSCAIRGCLQAKGGHAGVSNLEISIIRPDGERVPISISAAPLRDATGTVIGGVETFRDLSALHQMRKEIEGRYTLEDIHTQSRTLGRVLEILPQIADSSATVLLLGESGTGKELFARAIHALSPRSGEPFVSVNCGALPEHLLESELFGYKAGAFTDAKKDKPGRFKLAGAGTIFLDEIGDMPLPLQVKLLRVLQEKRFEPLGAVAEEVSEARVVAATNRDLAAMVEEGGFRQDLYYRLNVALLTLPSLRERPEDILLLARRFIERGNVVNGLQETQREVAGLSTDVADLLLRHDFPGNVRELENVIEYAFILCPGGSIQIAHLPDYLQRMAGTAAGLGAAKTPRTMEEIRLAAVREALERNGGTLRGAARELKIGKDTVRRILERAGES